MKMAITSRIEVAASILLALLVTYGCAPKLIKMEKAELARIKAEGEIQAVHYSRATPTISDHDLEPQSPLAILFVPFDLWRERRLSKQVEELSLEDPVLMVKKRFVLALDTALHLKNVRLVQAPLVGDDLDELKATLGKGLVMDFKTNDWVIGDSRSTDYGVVYNGIFYSARSRIVRLEDSKILWQGVCVPKAIPRFGSWDELMAGNGTLLKVKLNESAEFCAQELLAQLVGKEFYEYLSEQAVSGEVQLPGATAILSPELVNLSPSVRAAWLFYAASRIEYRNNNHLDIPTTRSGVAATFEEDVYARSQMVRFWQKIRKEDRDDYLDALKKVETKHYLEAYVHVLVVRYSEDVIWREQFENWRKAYLPGHSAKTLATIRGN